MNNTQLPLTAARKRGICYFEAPSYSPVPEGATGSVELCGYPEHLHTDGTISLHKFVPWEGSDYQHAVGDRRDGRDPKHNRRASDKLPEGPVSQQIWHAVLEYAGLSHESWNGHYALNERDPEAWNRCLAAILNAREQQRAEQSKGVAQGVETGSGPSPDSASCNSVRSEGAATAELLDRIEAYAHDIHGDRVLSDSDLIAVCKIARRTQQAQDSPADLQARAETLLKAYRDNLPPEWLKLLTVVEVRAMMKALASCTTESPQ